MQRIASAFKTSKSISPALIIAVFGIWVVWGSMFFFTRTALKEWPPYWLAGARFVTSGVLSFAFLWLRGAPLPERIQWRNAGVVGFFLLVLGTGSTVFSQQWNTSGIASALAATATIWIALLSGLMLDAWPQRIEWAGIIVGIVGVLVLNAGAMTSGNAPAVAIAIGLFGTLSWSAGTVLSLKLTLPTGWMRTTAQMLIGGAVLLLISFVRGEHVTLTVSAQTLGAFAMLIVGSWLGFGSYMYLLANARSSLATSYAYMNPLVALLLGTFVAGEAISPIELLGIAVILASVAFIWLANARKFRVANDEQ